MRDPEKEIRPPAKEADSEKISGRRSEDHSTPPPRQSADDTTPDVSVTDLSATDWQLWISGYRSGYLHGLDRGRRHEQDETADLWREAVRIVHNAASIAPRDRSEDERQARRRAHWWSLRRGEVA